MRRSTRRLALTVTAAAIAAAALLSGCGSSSPAAGGSSAPTSASSATATKPASPSMGPAAPSSSASASAAGLQRIDVDQFAAVVAQPGVVVLDVRTPAEYAAGHLANAINIDVESGDFAAKVGELDRATTYAVYCRSGNRSRVATEAMAQDGFTSLYDLDGGINDWAAAGQPVVT